jgi:hypothetical protein
MSKITARQMKAAEAKVQRARQKYLDAQTERADLIHAALADGSLTNAEICQATGLTSGRVTQISQGKRS